MKTFRKYFALSFAIIALSIVSVDAQGFSRSSQKPGKSIERQIYKKLLGLPRYGVFDLITYQVNGDTVILGGKVITLGTKRAAASTVKDIPGISNVVNNIEELPPSPYDDRIRRQALRTFTDRGPGQYFSTINPEVRIIVDRGRIFLEGYVSRSSDSHLLNILANGISGVFQVQNNLIVGKDLVR